MKSEQEFPVLLRGHYLPSKHCYITEEIKHNQIVFGQQLIKKLKRCLKKKCCKQCINVKMLWQHDKMARTKTNRQNSTIHIGKKTRRYKPLQ